MNLLIEMRYASSCLVELADAFIVVLAKSAKFVYSPLTMFLGPLRRRIMSLSI